MPTLRPLLIAATATACLGRDAAPTTAGPTPWTPDLPASVDEMPVPADNPFTVEGIELGRHLFYDTMLSTNAEIACASCHQQEHAFSDPRPKSLGVGGQLGRRHSMPLFNLAWSERFFWDGRAGSIEEQVLMPIQDPTEMAMDLDVLLTDLRASERYPPMFEAAFPGQGITRDTLSRALAQFVRSITSFDSPWDHINNVEDLDDEAAVRGHVPFSGKLPLGDPQGIRDMCDRCHQADAGLRSDHSGHSSGLFTTNEFKGNGLALGDDLGRYEASGDEADRGRFKVPTLRNLVVTGPYMHDGRFATLEETLDHYNEHIKVNAATDEIFLRDGRALTMNLDPAEFGDMIAFFDLFTDRTLLTNPAWSSPFEDDEP